MGEKKHTWTKETMDKCRKIFMDHLIFYHYNYTDCDFKQKNIARLLEQYLEIEKDLNVGSVYG